MANNVPGTTRATEVETVPRAAGTEAVTPAPPVAVARTQWGPIWGGLVTTISIFLVLEALFFAVGGLTPATAATVSIRALWVQWVLALAAFLAGGIVASVASPVRGPAAGVLNGFLVWALTTSLILAASLFGAGATFGAVGAFIGRTVPSHLTHVTPGALHAARTVGAWALLTLISTGIIAMIGGWLGDFGQPIGHVAREKRPFTWRRPTA